MAAPLFTLHGCAPLYAAWLRHDAGMTIVRMGVGRGRKGNRLAALGARGDGSSGDTGREDTAYVFI